MSKIKYDLSRKIRNWAREDRPREKLLLKGKSALSDAELIAILIGTGTASLSAVDLAKAILNLVDNSVKDLSRLSVRELTNVKGIGEAKAITLMAALELGRRRRSAEITRKRIIRSSYDAYEEMKPEFTDKLYEEMWLLLLNRSHYVIKKIQLSTGGVSGTFVDIKVIFKYAMEHLASAVILLHNHPSGNPQPSESDRLLTRKLVSAGKLVDIKVLDHIIFADRDYYSFKDQQEI